MKPYYQEGGITIYHGDCRGILPQLDVKVDLVLTDPPYGMAWNGKITAGKNGHSPNQKSSNYGATVVDDDKPFDPSPFINYPEVIMWGFHHFSSRLPEGSVLAWVKRNDEGYGTFLSDADLAWMKGGCGVYCFRDMSLYGETLNKYHPTQKPIPLIKWCLGLKPKAQTILDPFMGSGTTLVAAKILGRKAIGIEIEEKYCEIAAKRLMQSVMNLEIAPQISEKNLSLDLEGVTD